MYYSRLIDKAIERTLASSGAIHVAGPKFCGKTTTCMRYQKSFIRLNSQNAISIAKLDPKQALVGDRPRLIDEWQTVPDIWNCVKEILDEDYQFGSYILTGSSTPADKTQIHHSGAGRITTLPMNTMSLFESLESSGKVSLLNLFNGEPIEGIDLNEAFSINDLAFLICRGGWPLSLVEDRNQALDITRNYFNSLFFFEDSDNERFRNKRPQALKMLLRSYARNISTEASCKTILNDIKESNATTMDPKTFDSYMEALEDIFIIRDLEAWSPAIRSKTSIVATPTRHFVDTSIACRALGLAPSDLVADIKSFGYFFEDFAVRDLCIYAQALGAEVRHYRDNAGLECDAVIHMEDGRWGAVEIKIGGNENIEKGVKSLKTLQSKIKEKTELKEPSFLMVLTGLGACYHRPDGISVVPINVLKP